MVFVLLFGGNILILALLSAYNKKNSDTAIRYHCNAQLVMTLSYLFVFARLFSSMKIFAILNSATMMASLYLEALALSSLADILTPRMRKNLAGVFYCGLFVYVVFAIAFDLIHIRIVIISLISFALILYPSLRVLRTRNRSTLLSLLGILFLFMVAATAIRIVDAIRIGPDLVLFGPSLGESVTLVSFYVYIVLGSVGIILLAKEKTDARLVRLANYDSATGALNRDGFIAAMTSSVERCSYDNEAFSMILIDIDSLDEINDIDGFAAGDKIIVHAAERLVGEVGGSGFVGRLSGDEFMVFLKAVDSRHIHEAMAKLQVAVVVDPPDDIPFTVSAGAATFDYPAGRSIGLSQIYTACSGALRGAKKNGYGSRVVAIV
jgi:diguanylate cyclase (GGDEF)-like protein